MYTVHFQIPKHGTSPVYVYPICYCLLFLLLFTIFVIVSMQNPVPQQSQYVTDVYKKLAPPPLVLLTLVLWIYKKRICRVWIEFAEFAHIKLQQQYQVKCIFLKERDSHGQGCIIRWVTFDALQCTKNVVSSCDVTDYKDESFYLSMPRRQHFPYIGAHQE